MNSNIQLSYIRRCSDNDDEWDAATARIDEEVNKLMRSIMESFVRSRSADNIARFNLGNGSVYAI